VIGKLPDNVLASTLETPPVEFSALDADDKVLAILNEMKAGKRDKDGKYLGCLEATQDITDIQKLEGERRLLE
jgi:DUF438 domain-containing protein